MEEDVDLSDQGVPTWDGLTRAERRAELRRLGLTATQLEDEQDARSGPRRKATARQRGRAIALARRNCGWSSGPRSKRLLADCSRCSAPSMTWCRVRGKSTFGHLCGVRGKA